MRTTLQQRATTQQQVLSPVQNHFRLRLAPKMMVGTTFSRDLRPQRNGLFLMMVWVEHRIQPVHSNCPRAFSRFGVGRSEAASRHSDVNRRRALRKELVATLEATLATPFTSRRRVSTDPIQRTITLTERNTESHPRYLPDFNAFETRASCDSHNWRVRCQRKHCR
jgi:hypothetical protein